MHLQGIHAEGGGGRGEGWGGGGKEGGREGERLNTNTQMRIQSLYAEDGANILVGPFSAS